MTQKVTFPAIAIEYEIFSGMGEGVIQASAKTQVDISQNKGFIRFLWTNTACVFEPKPGFLVRPENLRNTLDTMTKLEESGGILPGVSFSVFGDDGRWMQLDPLHDEPGMVAATCWNELARNHHRPESVVHFKLTDLVDALTKLEQ